MVYVLVIESFVAVYPIQQNRESFDVVTSHQDYYFGLFGVVRHWFGGGDDDGYNFGLYF